MSGDQEIQQPNGRDEYAEKAVKAAAKENHDPAVAEQNTATVAQTEKPVQQTSRGVGNEHQIVNGTGGTDILVGPLLNYRRMSKEHTESPVWHGSVLIVTAPGSPQPELRLRMVRTSENDIVTGAGCFTSSVKGDKLYEELKAAFWAFPIEVPFQVNESQWEYVISGLNNKTHSKDDPSGPKHFWIPAKTESMRIMFHSCNGFSVGTDEEAWSGCALWNDVIRVHQKKPIHVMIGGGDQIYNDGVRVTGPLKPWTDISDPRKRRHFPFNEDLRDQCDKYYFENYVRWYGTEPFSTANAQIPQLNIWDDHDIIDGFGSYTDHFMQCPVFRGIGGVAHKYYLLFQHHLPPPKSTYTTDAPATTSVDNGTQTAGTDAVQLKNSWVKTLSSEDPSYIIGQRAGPYVEERSRSMYAQLGARVAFVGIDARTERTRHQINYPQTYDMIFDRVSKEVAASKGNIKHLILLLGVPIAYPRLQWLEAIIQSPIIGPMRFLNKRFGFAGGFFNQFDGAVDLQDDLDDHYTARQHKKERKSLILRLQNLAKEHNLRVSILGGDVHLAALGRFYSNPKLNIPAENDHRFITNIISSAITNKPPPTAVANLLARRNKIHHLTHDTDETLLNLFDVDPGKEKGLKSKSSDSNHCTMPSRNYALISESNPVSARRSNSTTASTNGAAYTNGTAPTNGVAHTNGTAETNGSPHLNGTDAQTNGTTAAAAETNGTATDASGPATNGVNGTHAPDKFIPPSNPRDPLHKGEVKCGISHPASDDAMVPSGLCGDFGLDVCIRVEIDQSDREGHTKGYGLSIPALTVLK